MQTAETQRRRGNAEIFLIQSLRASAVKEPYVGD
jgi:hypothetical protein